MRVGNHPVSCFLMYHYDKADLGSEEYVDVRIVLRSADKTDDRIMRRIGYLETRYKEQRDWDDFYKDFWWKYVRFR